MKAIGAAGPALAIALAGWAVLLWTTLDMGHPLVQLTMPASPRWTPAETAAVLALWVTMMAAMMLPSALPMLRCFGQLSRRAGQPMQGLAFLAAYLTVWSLGGAVAAGLQWALQRLDWINPMLTLQSRLPAAAVLLGAGAWQFTPWKHRCLSDCQHPLGFLMVHWQAGTAGAWRMGWRHGVRCVGCCGPVMTVLFVVGAMSLPWMVALAALVAAEKGLRLPALPQLLGAVLVSAGALTLLRA